MAAESSSSAMTWIPRSPSQSTSASDSFAQTTTVSIMLLGTDPDRDVDSVVVEDSGPCLALTRPPPTPRRKSIPLPSQASASEKPAILHPILHHPPNTIDLALPWTDVLQKAAASPLLWVWNNVASNPPLPSLAIIVKDSTSRPIIVFPSLGRAYITVGDIIQRVWEGLRLEDAKYISRQFMGMSEASCEEDCWILEMA